MNASNPKLYRAGTLIYTKRALGVLFIWLLWGDFCFTLMETVVPSLMPLKFQSLGASNAVIGLLITSIPGMIDTVMSPIISFKSDRCRSRWGRRIPFILLTLPGLVICLLGLGYGDRLGLWMHGHFTPVLGRFSPATVAVAVLGAMMVLFSFFNTFVNSAFWYLFNDVVPEALLARFMSWFRVVSLGAAAVYNLFIFKHATSHATEIFVGASALYFLGIGLMCLKVREGSYPPPPPYVGGGHGPIAAVKTYGRECFGLAHYWFAFLAAMGVRAAYVASVFNIFFYQSLGLSLERIGQLAFAYSLASAAAIPVSGWLADRYHPIRVVMLGVALRVLVLPLELGWLVWHPSAPVVFAVLLGAQVCLIAPIASMISTMDPPLFMRIFPRERYGQFCSANAMLRAIAGIVAGFLIGVYLDSITEKWGKEVAYRCLPLWNLGAYAVALLALIPLRRSWQRNGGDAAYAPPIPTGGPPGNKSPLLTRGVSAEQVQ